MDARGVPNTVRRWLAVGLAATVMGIAGCGGSSKTGTSTSASATTSTTPSTAITPPTSTVPVNPPAVAEIPAAERPSLSQFPSASGRTLIDLAHLIKGTASLGPADSMFTTGTQRFAFAISTKSQRYIYAPTAVYIASAPNKPAEGPFLAPDDPMTVAPQYRSQQNQGPGGLSAIYYSELPLKRSGILDVLALTRVGNKLIGSTGELAVALSIPIPAPGDHPPDIATDTLASTHGSIALVTTRTPPENMHSVSFNQVLGKKPVALLFSTPELCTSRVCGPVTDILVSLQHEFPQITFIHEEVYVDNNPSKGLRPQMHKFGLETEPWLFMVNRKGIITARLQGAFGVNEARAALESALRG
jgi:hypothetical protein